MAITATTLTALIGKDIPLPAPPELVNAIQSVEVTHSDSSRSGFKITFWMGRSGLASLTNYPLLKNNLLNPFNRVILTVMVNTKPYVVVDGVITLHQFQPSNTPGQSTLEVVGEDLGVLMDMEQKQVRHQPLSDSILVKSILIKYAQYGIVPDVHRASDENQPSPEAKPFQDSTDMRYLNRLAKRYGYVSYIYSKTIPGVNIAYWGPPIRQGLPQSALSINLGTTTNIEQIQFSYDALKPVRIRGGVQDAKTNELKPFFMDRVEGKPLSAKSALQTERKVRETNYGPTSGLTYKQATARAQGQVDAALDDVVTAHGTLNTQRYGSLLEVRRIVGVRGAGDTYDGDYYVQSVTHSMERGSYQQSFTLRRQGLGTASSKVVP